MNVILSDEQVAALRRELEQLRARRAPLNARIGEINSAIIASGEAKLAALRALDADLDSMSAGLGRGMTVRDQIAELEHLFPGGAWQFGSVWQSVPSGPDARNLTARRKSDGVLLAAADVPGLAEKIRHEEERGA